MILDWKVLEDLAANQLVDQREDQMTDENGDRQFDHQVKKRGFLKIIICGFLHHQYNLLVKTGS